MMQDSQMDAPHLVSALALGPALTVAAPMRSRSSLAGTLRVGGHRRHRQFRPPPVLVRQLSADQEPL